jgi:hypothetical protein
MNKSNESPSPSIEVAIPILSMFDLIIASINKVVRARPSTNKSSQRIIESNIEESIVNDFIIVLLNV